MRIICIIILTFAISVNVYCQEKNNFNDILEIGKPIPEEINAQDVYENLKYIKLENEPFTEVMVELDVRKRIISYSYVNTTTYNIEKEKSASLFFQKLNKRLKKKKQRIVKSKILYGDRYLEIDAYVWKFRKEIHYFYIAPPNNKKKELPYKIQYTIISTKHPSLHDRLNIPKGSLNL